jgi:hypothetical protein
MKSDDICDTYARKNVRLTVRLLNDEDVLIEGDPDALEFLGSLLLAHAREKTCGRNIGPHAAGNAFFTKDSTMGIYIHRVPCEHTQRRLKGLSEGAEDENEKPWISDKGRQIQTKR